MVHVLKVYVASPTGIPEIRRLTVSSDVLSSYLALAEKIIALVPRLGGKCFEMCWKDNEGDNIVITTDEELAQAVANNDDGIVRIHIRFSGADAASIEPPKSTAFDEVHAGVQCDGCNQKVVGDRYKCLQCHDYDLCSGCNAMRKHAFHDMLKLANPSKFTREWSFVGWRRLYKSMFGHEPQTEKIDRNEKNAHYQCPNETGTNPFPQVGEKCYQAFMDGNAAFLDNIGQFVTDVLNPLGVDVKFHVDQAQREAKAAEPEKTAESQSEPSKDAVNEINNSTETRPKTPERRPQTPLEQLKKDSQEKSQATQCEPSGVPLVSDGGARPKTRSPSPTETAARSVNGGLFVHPVSNETVPLKTALPVDAAIVAGVLSGQMTRSTSPSAPNQELNGSPDGWTVLNVPPSAVKEDKTEVLVPQASQEVHYPNLEGMATSPEVNSKENKKEPPPINNEYPEYAQLNAEVANAMIKMRAMGFTNEGGWLVRLLEAKKGDIYAALDSLYPYQRR